MSDKVSKIVDSIKLLSVLEAFELKKALEDEFGVSAAAPMMMGAMPAAAAAEPVEEKTEFDVILSDFGADKISVIKVVKNLTGLGLKEAKELVESLPKPIVEAASKDKAEDVAKQLTEAGGKVEMK